MDKRGTRILTLRGKNVIELKEDELGIPVTAHRNVTIPPRMGGVFHVDVNATFNTNHTVGNSSKYGVCGCQDLVCVECLFQEQPRHRKDNSIELENRHWR